MKSFFSRLLAALMCVALLLPQMTAAQVAIDPGARGMASKAQAAAAAIPPQFRQEKLNRLMASALLFNASDAPAMTSPPVITAVASPLQSVAIWPDNPSFAALFTMYGAKPVFNGTYWGGWTVTRPGGGIVDATHDAGAFRVAFRTDSPDFDFRTIGSSGYRHRFLVDGQYADKVGTLTLTNAGPNWIHVSFPTRKMRRIDIVLEKGALFGGINIASADTIVPVSTTSIFREAIFGDSITINTGVARSDDGYVANYGRRLGNMDYDAWAMGIGSTGYLNDGTSPGVATWRVSSHLDDLLFAKFDEVSFVVGINDVSSDLPGLKAAAIATWQGARQRVGPDVPIIVWGVFAGPPAYSASSTKEAALKEAFDQWADPNSRFIPFRGARPLQTGGTLDASVTGSISGTTLTVTATASGALAVGQVLMASDNILPETYITSGSGNTWTVSKAQTLSSQTIGASNPANGNFGFWGGGTTGIDTIHPSKYGHDWIASWMAAQRRALSTVPISYSNKWLLPDSYMSPELEAMDA